MKQVWVVALAAALLGGCAVQQHLRRGDRFLMQGQYTEAISAYEEALRISPGHKTAHERIRTARREAVRTTLSQADQALSAGELATALRLALRARRMPLDLEDVDLVRRIDATIDKAAKLAEARVSNDVAAGHFLAAVDLSRQIVDASPGVASRQDWAEEVRQKATQHYLSLAKGLVDDGLHGSAAIQLAMARRVGAEVKVDEVRDLWNRFAEPTCFAEPKVVVVDDTRKADALVAKIETTARTELLALRDRCGQGTRELGVVIRLTAVDVTDEAKSQRAAKPLPGAEVETEEVYYEEEPYLDVETYTEHETRIEKREQRDCAPRPGKERGCVTWVEEVEVKVPIQKTRQVQKVRKIRKTRPVQGPLPEDKVLTYEVTTVTRRVHYKGTVTLAGDAAGHRPFDVSRESVDASNPEASSKGLVIPADPLEVKELSALSAEAAEAVAEDVRRAVAEAVEDWTAGYEKAAGKRVLNGQMPQAEELYLKLLALGAEPGKGLARFFDDRYGRNVAQVMELLAAALGREVVSRPAGEQGSEAAAASFPKRVSGEEEAPAEPVTAPASIAPMEQAIVSSPTSPGTDAKSGISEEELRALEESSMDVLTPKAAKPPEGDGGNGQAQQTQAEGGEAGAAATPGEDHAPATRRPVPVTPN